MKSGRSSSAARREISAFSQERGKKEKRRKRFVGFEVEAAFVEDRSQEVAPKNMRICISEAERENMNINSKIGRLC